MTYILVISQSTQSNSSNYIKHMDNLINYVESYMDDPYCISVIGDNNVVKTIKDTADINEWRFLSHNEHTIHRLDSHLKESPDIIYCMFQKIKSAEELNILKLIYFYDKLKLEKRSIRPIIKVTSI